MTEQKKWVFLMRGLPGCGKSHMATRLAGRKGVVLETDQYFYTHVGSDPSHYDYDPDLLVAARAWNLSRFYQAVADNISPIVVDRGNGLNAETNAYAAHATAHGYRVELREPDSSWWQEIRVLLKYKDYVADEVFDAWAERLSESTLDSHRVPAKTIRHRIDCWRHDLTVQDILDWKEEESG